MGERREMDIAKVLLGGIIGWIIITGLGIYATPYMSDLAKIDPIIPLITFFFIGGLIAGLISRSGWGGIIAGFLAAIFPSFIAGIIQYGPTPEALKYYIELFQEIISTSKIQFFISYIVAMLAGFAGGKITTSRPPLPEVSPAEEVPTLEELKPVPEVPPAKEAPALEQPTPVPEVPPVFAAPTYTTCPRCGEPNDPVNRYCKKCGERLQN